MRTPSSDGTGKSLSPGKYVLTLGCSFLAAPLATLLVLRGDRAATLRSVDLWLLVAVVALPGLYCAVLLGLARNGDRLARHFRTLLRASLAALALVLVLEGALALLSILYASAAALLLLAFGAGLVIAGVLAVAQWPHLFEVSPLDVDGLVLAPERMRSLTDRVTRLATALDAHPPTRIIVGVRPRAFVATVPIHLRGSGPLPPAETLYLPLVALRALRDTELDALIGHELAHFRARDFYFTERFGPDLLALQRSAESVSKPGDELLLLGRLPAMVALLGMTWLLLHLAGPIRRQRELAADRAALQVSDPRSVIGVITKLTFLGLGWRTFERKYGILVHRGTGRRNLVKDYFRTIVHLLGQADRASLERDLLATKIAHPFDSHPTLVQRAAAIGVDAPSAVAAALTELMQCAHDDPESVSLEEEATAIATELARRPGGTITISDKELSFAREASSPVAANDP